MSSVLQTVLVFLLSLGFIVFLHELGHYISARILSVKIKQFSIGFGKSIACYTSKSGELFTIGLIPLGGFVRMLHSTDEDCVPANEALAFDKQSIWKRLVIVLAGPFVNFILAIFLFFCVFVLGVNDFKPVLDIPPKGSLADKKGIILGDTVLSVNDQPIQNWSDLSLALTNAVSSAENVRLVLNRQGSGPFEVNFTADPFIFKTSTQPVREMGFHNFIPVPPIIARVEEGSPANLVGLNSGDKIIAVNGIETPYWSQVVHILRALPNQYINLEIYSPQQNVKGTKRILLASKGKGDTVYGFLGVEPVQPQSALDEVIVYVKLSPFESLVNAFDKTWQSSIVTLHIIGKLVTGQATLKHLSGPVSIAKSTSRSFSAGFVYWLSILAAISVSLGVLNLLPIPVLDGGHALFYIIEWFKGSPVPDSIVSLSYQLGFLLLILIMAIAFANDLALF